MNIEDLLKLLTPEQLEELARIKRSENTTEAPVEQPTIKEKPTSLGKRKQQRKKKKSSTESKSGTLEKIMGKKGNPSHRTNLELGPRPNKFITSEDYSADQESILLDKKLWGNRKPSARNRVQALVDAKCTKCDCVYEDIPASNCYRDGGENVFVCDECSKGMGS